MTNNPEQNLRPLPITAHIQRGTCEAAVRIKQMLAERREARA